MDMVDTVGCAVVRVSIIRRGLDRFNILILDFVLSRSSLGGGGGRLAVRLLGEEDGRGGTKQSEDCCQRTHSDNGSLRQAIITISGRLETGASSRDAL
jgi:hypothetical protein